MHIPYRILIGKKLKREERSAIEKVIAETFLNIDRIYNNWNPTSEVGRINQLAKETKTPISTELYTFFNPADVVIASLKPLFDPAYSPLYSLWKERLKQKEIPHLAEIENISQVCGWEKIHFQEGLFWKDFNETALDFCGIAKGYCVDLLAEKILALGFKDALIDWAER